METILKNWRTTLVGVAIIAIVVIKGLNPTLLTHADMVLNILMGIGVIAARDAEFIRAKKDE